MPLVLVTKYRESIYLWYIEQVGGHLFIIATLTFMCSQAMHVYSDNWMAVWLSRKYTAAGYTSDAFYAGVYGLLFFVFLCFFSFELIGTFMLAKLLRPISMTRPLAQS